MTSRFLLPWCLASLCVACTALPAAVPSVGPHGEPGAAASADSIVPLRKVPAPDSVVLQRGDASIVLSMHDVEAYFSQWPLPPDMAEFREQVRGDFRANGWARLGTGMLPDVVAADLIVQGKATIRSGSQAGAFPWIRLATERDIGHATVVTHRLLYTPGGKLLLRVLYSVAIS